MLAMIQMDTQNDKGINLEQASAWIDEAALRGVKLVCFPEVMNLIGRNDMATFGIYLVIEH